MTDVPPCPDCGLPHVTRHGTPSCTGHAKHTARPEKRRPDGRPSPCTQPPLKGLDVCAVHGGKAPRAKAAAEKRVAEQTARRELARLGQPRVIDPGAAILDLVHWTAGEVQFWRHKVVQLAETDEEALTWGMTSSTDKTSGQWPGTDVTHSASEPVAYKLMVDASNRLERYATAALKAGVEERRVRLAEQQGQIAVELIRRILDALYAALVASGISEDLLRAAWAAAVEEVVPREIRAMDALTRGETR